MNGAVKGDSTYTVEQYSLIFDLIEPCNASPHALK